MKYLYLFKYLSIFIIRALTSKSEMDFYDKVAPAYDYLFKNDSLKRSIFPLFNKIRIPKNGTVLDVGCGTGTLTTMLKPYCKNIIAIDYSKQMISKAIANNTFPIKNNRIRYIQANMFALPFPDGYFDAITCFGIMYHVRMNYFQTFIEELRRVSKSKAKIIIGFRPFPWRLFWFNRNQFDPSKIDIILIKFYNLFQTLLGLNSYVGLHNFNSLKYGLNKAGFEFNHISINHNDIVIGKRFRSSSKIRRP